MIVILHELLTERGRLSPAAALASLGVALLLLRPAVWASVTLDGGYRIAFLSAIGLASIGNLLRGLGSLLPEERGGREARLALTPIFVLMLVALTVTLLFLPVGLRH